MAASCRRSTIAERSSGERARALPTMLARSDEGLARMSRSLCDRAGLSTAYRPVERCVCNNRLGRALRPYHLVRARSFGSRFAGEIYNLNSWITPCSVYVAGYSYLGGRLECMCPVLIADFGTGRASGHSATKN